MFASLDVENAAHGIELAEVESEYNHVCLVLWVWGWKWRLTVASQHLGSESPDFIRTAPTPNPGLT